MSIRLDLGICVTTPGLTRPNEAAQAIADKIGAMYGQASGGDIELVPRIVDAAGAGVSLPKVVSSDMLHEALEAVTGRQRNRTKVTSTGILLAGHYAPRPDFFGYMFDEAFVPGTSNPWISTPREGCAVFLAAIFEKRAQAEFIEEVVYTATHEFGHVLNLQHSPEPSYMARSADRPTAFDLGTCLFSPKEQRMLASCSQCRFIWPGGSRFEDLGPFADSMNPLDGPANSPEPLRLRISMANDSFWRFEPVELDVELGVKPGADRPHATVPDMLDPGYGRFSIWIEEPNGERRRYLSPRHYCDHSGRRVVSADRPLRRDISVFGQSGSFTFQTNGVHRLQATYALSHQRILRSNVVEVSVRAPRSGEDYVTFRKVFGDRHVGQLLYYRRLAAARLRKTKPLSDFAAAYPRHQSTAMIHYALGRASAHFSKLPRAKNASSAYWKREAVSHLRVALRRRSLGDHRRGHAERTLLELGG